MPNCLAAGHFLHAGPHTRLAADWVDFVQCRAEVRKVAPQRHGQILFVEITEMLGERAQQSLLDRAVADEREHGFGKSIG